MKVIVAGSRGFTDVARLFVTLDHFHAQWPITAIISGTASGADTLGEQWAVNRGVPVIRMPADWDTHGKSARYKRNEQMAGIGDYLMAFWDGKSRGTKHMIDIAERKGLTMTVIRYTHGIRRSTIQLRIHPIVTDGTPSTGQITWRPVAGRCDVPSDIGMDQGER